MGTWLVEIARLLLSSKRCRSWLYLSYAGSAEAQPTEAAAGPSAAPAAAPAAEEEGDSIDPEFLAALPPEIQAEVLEQQRRERRMRERQRQQQQAAAAAAAAAQVNSSPTCPCAGSVYNSIKVAGSNTPLISKGLGKAELCAQSIQC